MSTRIAVMNPARSSQIGTPAEIYEYPQSKFVADFIGSVNLFEGRVAEDHPEHVIIDSPEAGCQLYISHGLPVPVGTQVWVAVRPEKIAMLEAATAMPAPPTAPAAMVKEIAYIGNLSIYLIALPNGKTVRVTAPNVIAPDRDADHLGGRGPAVLAALRRRGADAMTAVTASDAADGAAPRVAAGPSILRRLSGRLGRSCVIAVPYVWLLLFFLVPFVDRPEDRLRRKVIGHAALHAAVRLDRRRPSRHLAQPRQLSSSCSTTRSMSAPISAR